MTSPPRYQRLEQVLAIACGVLLVFVVVLGREPSKKEPQPHTWLSGPVVIQLEGTGGYTSYQNWWGRTPDLVVYSDGRIVGTLFRRNAETYPSRFRQGMLSDYELCALLYQIENYGFYDFSQDDYVTPGVKDAGSDYFSIQAWRENSILAYALVDSINHDPDENLEVGKTYQALIDLHSRLTERYHPDQVAVLVVESEAKNSAAELWPIPGIRLAAAISTAAQTEPERAFARGEILLTGANAAVLLDTFQFGFTKDFREGEKVYSITIRPFFPHEIWEKSTDLTMLSIFEDAPERPLSCRPPAEERAHRPIHYPTPVPPEPAENLPAPWEKIFTIGAREEPGQLYNAWALAIDPDGNLLVSDNGNDRLQRFTLDGVLLEIIPLEDSSPRAMSYAPDGNLIIADWIDNEIEVRSSDGLLLRTYTDWPSRESDTGNISNHIDLLALGPSGEIYIGATGGDRVIFLDANGGFLQVWNGTENWPVEDLSDLKTDAAGNLYAALGAPGRILIRTPGGLLRSIRAISPRAVAPSENGDFYFTVERGDIRLFNAEGDFLTHWPAWNIESSLVAPDGSLIVLIDTASFEPGEAIMRFAQDGKKIASFGTTNLQPGQFDGSAGFSVSPLGDVWVVTKAGPREDISSYALVHVDPEGDHIAAFQSLGGRPFSCEEYRLAALSNQSVIVADRCTGTFQLLTSNNIETTHWGGLGTDPGEYNLIESVALAADGASLFIIDSGNRRLVQTGLDGEILQVWTSEDFGVRNLDSGSVSPDGTYFVLDGSENVVVLWNESSGMIERWNLPSRIGCARSITYDPLWKRLYVYGGNLFYVLDANGDFLGGDVDCIGPRINPSIVQIGSSGKIYYGSRGVIVVSEPTDP